MLIPRSLLLAALLFSYANSSHAAGVVTDTLLQETLVLLDERLNSPAPVHAVALLDDAADRSRASTGQLRGHLLQRLDEFSQLADTDSAAWRAVLDLRDESMSQRQARRLLRELVGLSRRVLESSDDYLLGTGIRWAGAEAHVPQDEASGFARRLVAHGIVDTTTEWAPEPKGLVVSGWTEQYEFSLDPLYVFFDTDNESFVTEAVRDIQRFVVPRAVRRLPSSRGVRYAVRDRNVTTLIDPDLELRITVVSLRFGGSNVDLKPCMDVQLELTRLADDATTWRSSIAHCTEENGSASVNELDNFYEEVADLIYDEVDTHFETR